MANEEHVQRLLRGVEGWNAWRRENQDVELELEGADLSSANLTGVDLRSANLSGADLSHAKLVGANFSDSNLRSVNLEMARAEKANFSNALLTWARFGGAVLVGANFEGAELIGTHFGSANLTNARMANVVLHETMFGSTNLQRVTGLEDSNHSGPSTIDHRTIELSGNLPEKFLRGCGLSNWQIEAAKLNTPRLSKSQIGEITARMAEFRFAQVHKKQVFSLADKQRYARLVESPNSSVAVVAAEVGVHPSTLSRWRGQLSKWRPDYKKRAMQVESDVRKTLAKATRLSKGQSSGLPSPRARDLLTSFRDSYGKRIVMFLYSTKVDRQISFPRLLSMDPFEGTIAGEVARQQATETIETFLALRYTANVAAGAFCCAKMEELASEPLVWRAVTRNGNPDAWKFIVYSLCEMATLIVLDGNLSEGFMEELQHIESEPTLRAKSAFLNHSKAMYFVEDVAAEWRLDKLKTWSLEEIEGVLAEAEKRLTAL